MINLYKYGINIKKKIERLNEIYSEADGRIKKKEIANVENDVTYLCKEFGYNLYAEGLLNFWNK